MLEHFVLSNLLLAVCCWSSSYFPLLLWVLWLMDHFLHDQCCSSHDDWTLLSNLDTNLQTGWSLCSVPLWINLLFPPTLLFYSCAIYPFACFQSHQCWVSGFSSILRSGTERGGLEYPLRWWLPRSQQDTLPNQRHTHKIASSTLGTSKFDQILKVLRLPY